MSHIKSYILFSLALVMAVSCKTVVAPKGSVPSRKVLDQEAYGGWVTLTLLDSQKVSGELIALTTHAVVLMNTSANLYQKDSIVGARLVIFNNQSGSLATLTALGSFSTISHGLFLPITLPMWLISGITTSRKEARRINYVDLTKDRNWEILVPFARFPQGLPPNVDLRSLLPRPVK